MTKVFGGFPSSDLKKILEIESRIVEIENNDKSGYPAPYIYSISSTEILIGYEKNITVLGSFFTPETTVTLSAGIVKEWSFISSHQIEIVIEPSSSEGFYDLTIDNGVATTLKNAIEYFDFSGTLVDLRTGGATFSSAAIEMASGMSLTRTEEGLFFSGKRPYSSAVKFVGDSNNDWIWNKTENKTLSWVFINSEVCLCGVGSPQIDINKNNHVYSSEIAVFLYDRLVDYMYGNSDSSRGGGIGQSFQGFEKNPTDIIKIKFIPKNDTNWEIKFYLLPSASLSSWFDESNLIAETTAEGFGNANRDNLPFLITANGQGSNFLGFIID